MILAGKKLLNPELLAPAGDWQCLRAAAAAGADAVYFGLEKFNARMRAENFCAAELPAVMGWLHERGLKGYVTLNILIFQNELEECAQVVAACARAGVDAVIVQDLGVARLARLMGVPVHASTQMTVTSPEGAVFAKRLGAERVVLARETSLRELQRFGDCGVELEVFVHGALCVAYSGQCLTSEALGERSANRGECAQACRMPYELVVDGVTRDLGDKRYLLSPQDLAAVEHVPALIERGVSCFKIEGRLKSPEYVAAVCSVYRRAIDEAWEGRWRGLTEEERYRLEMVFSRGLYDGWMRGVNHQELVHARFGKKRGPFVGRAREIFPQSDAVRLDVVGGRLKAGDGIVFDTAGDTNDEDGARVFAVEGDVVRLMRGRVRWERLRPGALVWKTSDPALERELARFAERDVPRRGLELDWEVSGGAGESMRLVARCGSHRLELSSTVVLEPARSRPLSGDFLREQLGRLGGTGFECGVVDVTGLAGDVILPVSEINRLRRAAVEALRKQISGDDRETLPGERRPSVVVLRELLEKVRVEMSSEVRILPSDEKKPSAENRSRICAGNGAEDGAVELSLLCRTEEQLAVCVAGDVGDVYLDFEDVRRYRAAAERWGGLGSRLWLATPRIIKAGETGYLKLIAAAGADGVLVRNLGAIEFFHKANVRMRGDFSLNMANALTAGVLQGCGLECCTVSFDLNGEQVLDLARAVPENFLEVVIHQHMPLFHMEHCVFAAFLSNGKDYRDCGRPCERHRVELRDRVGQLHTLGADAGCRNTLFHGRAQSAVDWLERFLGAGLRRLRIDLLSESAGQTKDLLNNYRRFLRGEKRLRAEILAGAVAGLGVASRAGGVTL